MLVLFFLHFLIHVCLVVSLNKKQKIELSMYESIQLGAAMHRKRIYSYFAPGWVEEKRENQRRPMLSFLYYTFFYGLQEIWMNDSNAEGWMLCLEEYFGVWVESILETWMKVMLMDECSALRNISLYERTTFWKYEWMTVMLWEWMNALPWGIFRCMSGQHSGKPRHWVSGSPLSGSSEKKRNKLMRKKSSFLEFKMDLFKKFFLFWKMHRNKFKMLNIFL